MHMGPHVYAIAYVCMVKIECKWKNKTFLQLIALNLKCCKINSRVMPNTQAQSFMQTETAARGVVERGVQWENGKSRVGAVKGGLITAERLLKRPDKCAVETDTHGRTWLLLACGESGERRERRERGEKGAPGCRERLSGRTRKRNTNSSRSRSTQMWR